MADRKKHNYPAKRKSKGKKPGPRPGPVKTSVEKKGLTDLEWEAINHYFTPEVNFNRTEALRRAGYAHPGAQVTRVFHRPAVVKEIDRRRKGRAELFKVGEAEVLQELSKIAFFNMADFAKNDDNGDFVLTEDGHLIINMANVNREQLAAIGEYTIETYYEGTGDDAVPVKKVKFKPFDKMGALDKLARHLGLFQDRIKIEGEDNLATAILAARRRVRQEEKDAEDEVSWDKYNYIPCPPP